MATTWNIDTSHSSIHFSVRHMMIAKVRGAFNAWSGSIAFDDANVSASKIQGEIDVASIDTAEPKRDGHLKSPDFFDIEKFPHLGFKSTSVEKKGETLAVHGDLTLHGVTKPVTLGVEFHGRAKHPMNGSERAGFSAHTHINRKDFGLGWNAVLEAGGVAVSEKVEIAIEIQAIKA